MTDQDLIVKIIKGDDSSYATLIERYERGLIRYCFTIVHDADQAEDIAQDSFIKAYAQLSKYKPQFKFSTWLYRIAHNIAINAVHKPDVLPLSDEYEIAYHDQTPEVIEREKRELQVRLAVSALPVNFRTVIHLHYFEHHSYEEIGQVMDVPETTIKTWLFRARQQLKEDCYGIIG